jgi:protocatechuate 3,4-dioxygenase beta subunit
MALLGVTGAAWLTRGALHAGAPPRAAAQACIVRPQQTEGPYFADDRLNREDITADPETGKRRAGAPLSVTLIVSRLHLRMNAGKCEPLPGAQVDLWHCDAMGIYSDVRDRRADTLGEKFLRGYQTTDARGAAHFATIYPGWYPGRTVHIHFKIRAKSNQHTHEFTSQLYFDDALTDIIHATAPYAGNGERRTRNRNDGIYQHGGDRLMLDVTRKANVVVASLPLAMQF